jgi:hypothetical protein
MSKKYKITLVIIALLIIVSVGLLVYKNFFYKETETTPTVYSSIIDTMDNYGYTLDDRDTEIFKEKYYELKEILEQENIDYQKYSEKISELFVIDLFTISNKVNKYDVGGLEFLYSDEREMFKNKVMDTLYEQVEDNSYDTRNQDLPTVSKTTIEEVKETTYEIDENKLEAYEITISIEYEKDLGYDSKCNITVVKDDNMMYIVEYTASK